MVSLETRDVRPFPLLLTKLKDGYMVYMVILWCFNTVHARKFFPAYNYLVEPEKARSSVIKLLSKV